MNQNMGATVQPIPSAETPVADADVPGDLPSDELPNEAVPPVRQESAELPSAERGVRFTVTDEAQPAEAGRQHTGPQPSAEKPTSSAVTSPQPSSAHSTLSESSEQRLRNRGMSKKKMSFARTPSRALRVRHANKRMVFADAVTLRLLNWLPHVAVCVVVLFMAVMAFMEAPTTNPREEELTAWVNRPIMWGESQSMWMPFYSFFALLMTLLFFHSFVRVALVSEIHYANYEQVWWRARPRPRQHLPPPRYHHPHHHQHHHHHRRPTSRLAATVPSSRRRPLRPRAEGAARCPLSQPSLVRPPPRPSPACPLGP